MLRRTVTIMWIAGLLLVAGVVHAQEAVPATPKRQPAKAEQKAGKLPVLPEEAPTKTSGKLFVQENSWDFGHVPQDAQVTHRFTIENVGSDTLYIQRIKPT